MANGTNECKGLRQIDPVQGLIGYVEDIKPYHSKVVEVLIEYVNQEFINVTVGEQTDWEIQISSEGGQLDIMTCDPGYGTEPYGGPGTHPIVTPNQSSPVAGGFSYGFTADSFAVPGDQTAIFRVGEQVLVSAFLEDYSNLHNITDITTGVAGSGSFIVAGDQTADFTSGDTFYVVGARRSKAFTVSSTTYNAGPDTTQIDVQQSVGSADIGQQLGLTRTFDSNNSGMFTITQTAFSAGMIDSWPNPSDPSTYELGNDPHTVVTVDHTFTTPNVMADQVYVASAHVDLIPFERVYAYSNFTSDYTTSPANIVNDPDEGAVQLSIQSVDTTQNQIVVPGNLQVSNLQSGDPVTITQSTANNGSYTITSISYDQSNDQTTLTVSPSITDSTADGFAQFDIASNMFIIDGDYRSRFEQGTTFTIIGGNLEGTYTTLYSDLVGGKTRIRTLETIVDYGQGINIVGTTTNNEIQVENDRTGLFQTGTLITIVGSDGNDGSYTVVAPGPSYDSSTNRTTIPLDSGAILVQTGTGQVFEIVPGLIKEHHAGFGDDSKVCDIVPETIISVSIDERLRFDGASLDLTDDIIAYNLENTDTWGYDLPLTTIISDSEPPVPEQSSEPSSPSQSDLWLDTSTNTFRQYLNGMWQPIVTAYWLDTDDNLFYYRTYNKVAGIDTGWIVYIAQSPEFSVVIPADSSAGTNAFVNAYSIEPHLVYHGQVTVDDNNDAYVLAGGNWIDRFTTDLTINAYDFDTNMSGFKGTWQVQSFPVWQVDDISDSFDVQGDQTWLFASGRVLSTYQTEHGYVPYTISSSSYDSTTNLTTVSVQENVPSLQQLENPIPVMMIDEGTDTITVRGDVGDRYPPGTTVVIANSTPGNNGEWDIESTAYNSGTDTTQLFVTGDIPDNDTTNDATIQLYASPRSDYFVIIGAVYDPAPTGSGAYATNQPKTIVPVTTAVDPTVDAITYTRIGPLRADISISQQATVRTTVDDKMYIDGTIYGTVSSYEITDTNASTNEFRINFVDPQLGVPVDLSGRFPPGTIFTVTGSFSDANPASIETNDSLYIVNSVSFEPGSGDTVIVIEDDYSKIFPQTTFTVNSVTNNAGSIPSEIRIAGDHVNAFDGLDYTEQFRLSEPLVSNTQLENVISVTQATYDSSNNETVLSINEELINSSFTGSLDVIRAEYRGNVYYDETNTTLPWEHGRIQLGATPIDENVTAATIIDTLDFGWGGTERWQIVSTDQSLSTVTVGGDLTSILDVYDEVRITGSQGNDGTYEVVGVTYNAGPNESDVELANPTLAVDPPVGLEGYLEADALDITNWFQFLIVEADSGTNLFTVYGDATASIQSGQQFRVYSTLNDGIYTAVSAPTYDMQAGTTDIPVASIENDDRGGWLQSYRDLGMFVTFEDMIGVSIAEQSEAAVLETAGSMVGAWDYDYFNIGSFDESLGTVIHLYSNSFSS